MGRNIKYKTEEEKKQAHNESAMKHYRKNKENIKKRNLQKYHDNKEKNKYA